MRTIACSLRINFDFPGGTLVCQVVIDLWRNGLSALRYLANALEMWSILPRIAGEKIEAEFI